MFLDQRLTVGRLQPVQAPPVADVATSAADAFFGPSKAMILEELGKESNEPLRQLTIHADGSLIIPSIADWGPGKNPPVSLTEELKEALTTMQKEFCQSTAPSPGTPTGPTPESPPPENKGTENVNPVLQKLASGAVFSDRAELLQLPGCSCKVLKEVVVPEEAARCLLVSIDGNEHRVLLEATADSSWQAGHFIGRGGPGSFAVMEGALAPGRKGANTWIFSRGTEWKKDVAYRANGMWVFERAASGVPVMKTLEAIRAEVGEAFVTLYGHHISNGSRATRVWPWGKRCAWSPTISESVEADVATFDMNSLGKFLQSWEKTGEAGIECGGVLRPAFSLTLLDNQMEPQGRGSHSPNPLCLFLKKNLKLKKGHIIVL